MSFLTPNEQETLHDFVRLKRIDQVAKVEHLSPHSVKNRLSRIYQKLRDAGDIGDGAPCMEVVEYVEKERKALAAPEETCSDA